MGCCPSEDIDKPTNKSNEQYSPLLNQTDYAKTYAQNAQNFENPNSNYNSIENDNLFLSSSIAPFKSSPPPQSKQQNDNKCFGECNSANQTTVLTKLWNIEPLGKTKLRDALVAACLQLHVLQKVIGDMTDRSGDDTFNWRFVNVVLTDGQDTASEHSLIQVKGVLFALNQLLGKNCSTFLIGIGSNENEFGDLKDLDRDMDTVSYINVQDSSAIEDVFERIQVKLGIVRQTALIATQNALIAAHQDKLAINVKRNRFLVIFTIDKSGSMSGGKWKQTCKGLANFLSHLNEGDLFGVQVFSDDVTWLEM